MSIKYGSDGMQNKPLYPTEALLAARAVFFNKQNIEKGDSWQGLGILQLWMKLEEEIDEWKQSKDPKELLDIINTASMLYVREQKPPVLKHRALVFSVGRMTEQAEEELKEREDKEYRLLTVRKAIPEDR